jgi:hypothetical protein
MKPTPTTQVHAYVANDGSLWLDEAECLDKNQKLRDSNLFQHINSLCEGAQIDRAKNTAILEYILTYFDEIKTILKK